MCGCSRDLDTLLRGREAQEEEQVCAFVGNPGKGGVVTSVAGGMRRELEVDDDGVRFREREASQ